MTRWLLVINGLSGIARAMIGVTGYTGATMIPLEIWAGTLPIAAIFLAWRFKQDLRVAPTFSRVMRM